MEKKAACAYYYPILDEQFQRKLLHETLDTIIASIAGHKCI